MTVLSRTGVGGIRRRRGRPLRSRTGHVSDFRLNLLASSCARDSRGRIGLAWGREECSPSDRVLFFGLGAYIMAMHLKIADAELRGDSVPDFMQIAASANSPPTGRRSRIRSRPSPRSCSFPRSSRSCSASACSSAGSRARTSQSCRRRSRRRFAILLIGQSSSWIQRPQSVPQFFRLQSVRSGDTSDVVLIAAAVLLLVVRRDPAVDELPLR